MDVHAGMRDGVSVCVREVRKHGEAVDPAYGLNRFSLDDTRV